MDFIVDRTGAPLVHIGSQRYISVLPVTKYQFERYIWSCAPEALDYQTIVEKTGRVSPTQINKNNVLSAFMTFINFSESIHFCDWLKARLPTCNEWNTAFDMVFSNDNLFDDVFDLLQHSEHLNMIDIRLWKLIEVLKQLDIKRWTLKIQEIVPEFATEPYGRLFIRQGKNLQAHVTGNPPQSQKSTLFGFCYLIEKT